jgi:peptidoglycan/LPS O-acetylase OafA/YrhL
MSATNPLFAIGALAIALISVSIVHSLSGKPVALKSYRSLDGLRGYLAFLVFVHHAAVRYFYAHTGVWALPPSRLYTHCGQTSVALFFMITAFLFWSKLIDGRRRPIDWPRLYVSRVLRLVPLYVFAIASLWLIVAASSHFALRVSARRAVADTIKWLTFTAYGAPDLNGFAGTFRILAGVAWSLPYEWWFYFSLPLCATLFRPQQPRFWLVLSALGAALGARWLVVQGGGPMAASFLGGITAALIARSHAAPRLAQHPIATLVCLAVFAATVRTASAFSAVALVLLTVGFSIIACGNTLYGVLVTRPSRVLGEMGYSIYLLHGVVLFVLFEWIGASETATWSATTHWLAVYLCVPVLIALCHVTHWAIEVPAMEAVDRVMRTLNKPL